MKKFCVAVLCCGFSFCLVAQQNRYQPSLDIDPSQIDIVRDAFGVPHIFAKTDAEVAYGLAWAHAEDDFATIQKCFLAAKSMLGLQTGRPGATVDYVVHLLRIRELVDSLYDEHISAPFKGVLQGYCDGFNAYADAHPKAVLEKRAFPIRPHDILTYSVLQLAIGCDVESTLRDIIGGEIELAFPEAMGVEAAGSNAFAFNSAKTEDGNVYMTINTHHPLEGQVAWYEVHLASEEGWNIVGSLFPGSPIVLTGVNKDLGWTHTVNHPDKIDVYQLEMHPVNELQYRVDDAWLTLEEATVKLKMKVPGFNLHVKKKAYWSIFGPTLITDRGVFSIRTGGIMDIRGLEQWYRMNKARNFTEFRGALEMEALPGYNLVYADRYDTIYYLSNGRLPVRAPGYDWKGTVPGNTRRTLWTKFHPLEKLPQVLNPPSGYVYNTNHAPFKATAPADNISQADYDPLMGYETHDNNRSLRFRELLAEHDRIGFDDFRKIKFDVQLPEKLAYPVNMDTLFLLNEATLSPELADLARELKQWNRRATTDSKGAAVFAMVFYDVAERYLEDNSYRVLTYEDAVKALHHAYEHMMRHFGSTEVTLGDYQRLERGDQSLPLAGLPDVLAAMYSTPTDDGRVKGTIGDCYIALVKFTPTGPEIETISPYGASNDPESIHYADQMERFHKQKTKTMTLKKRRVYEEARTVYHPEVLSRLSAKLMRASR